MKTSLLVLLFIFVAANLRAQNFSWGNTIATPGKNDGISVAVDKNGSIYTLSIQGATITSQDSYGELVVQKYSPDGSAGWTRVFGGKIRPHEIAVDDSMYIYLTGSFDDSLVYPGKEVLAQGEKSDIFAARLDGDGKVVWLKTIHGPKDWGSHAYSIALDKYSNFYIAGGLDNEVFFAKYSSQGQLLFSKTVETSTHSNASGIAVDSQGNFYITGYYLSWARFDDIKVEQIYGFFLTKYDSSAKVVWVRSIGDAGTAIFDVKVKLDRDENLYWSGFMMSRLDFTPEFSLKPVSFFYDFFLAKYDVNGNFKWAHNTPANNSQAGFQPGSGNYLAVDRAGNVYVGGQFRDTLLWDEGASVISNYMQIEGAVIQYSPDGKVLRAKQTKGNNGSSINRPNTVNGLALNQDGEVYAIGTFHSPHIFLDETKLEKSASEQAVFITKLPSLAASSVEPRTVQEELELWPNPVDGLLNIHVAGQIENLRILDLMGRELFSGAINGSPDAALDCENLSPGFYVLHVQAGGKLLSRSFVVR